MNIKPGEVRKISELSSEIKKSADKIIESFAEDRSVSELPQMSLETVMPKENIIKSPKNSKVSDKAAKNIESAHRKELVSKIKSIKYKNEKGVLKPAFSKDEIQMLLKAEKKNPQLFDKIISYECKSELEKDKIAPRFSADVIVELMRLSEEHSNKAAKKLKLKHPDMRKAEIQALSKIYTNNVFASILDRTYINSMSKNEVYCYNNLYCIKDMISLIDEHPKATKKIFKTIDERVPKSNAPIPTIKKLIPNIEKYGDLYDKLSSMEKGKNYSENLRFSIGEICQMMEKYGECVTDLSKKMPKTADVAEQAQKEVRESLDRILEYSNVGIWHTKEINELLELSINTPRRVFNELVNPEKRNISYEHKMDFNEIRASIAQCNQYPELADTILDAGCVPRKAVIRSLIREVDEEPIPPEKYDIVFDFYKTEDVSGNKLLWQSSMFSDDMINLIKVLDHEDAKVITDIAQENSVMFLKVADVVHGINKNYPEKIDTLKQLYKNGIEPFNFEEFDSFASKSEDVQKKLFEKMQIWKEDIKEYAIPLENINEELFKKLELANKRFLTVQKIDPMTFGVTVQNPEISAEAIEEGLNLLDILPEKLLSEKEYRAGLFMLMGINKSRGIINKSFIDEYIKIIQKYDKLNENQKNIVDSLVTSRISTLTEDFVSLGDVSKNIEYFKDRYIYSEPRELIDKLLFSKGYNLTENNIKLNEILDTKKSKILKEVALRCHNTNPGFEKTAEEILDNPAFAERLMLLPDVSESALIDAFYNLSKVDIHIKTKPQDFINGKYDESVINAVRGRLEKKEDSMKYLDLFQQNEVEVVLYDIRKTINENYAEIMDAIETTDMETVKLLLDKRLMRFAEEIQNIVSMSKQEKDLVSLIIKHGKSINRLGKPDKLSGQKKLDVINLVKADFELQEMINKKTDIEKYMTPLKKGDFIFDIDGYRKDIFGKILAKNGMSEEELSKLKAENIDWDMRYISLFKNKPYKDEGELATMIKQASLGNFKTFIEDETNIFGKANAKTVEEFRKLKLNFDKWEKGPDIKKISLNNEDYTIKLWNRRPQESVFDGTYTTCCTSLDGSNGGSMASYLMNKSINVVEVKDKNGDVVAMSRCFVGNVEGKPSLMIENLEVNNNFAEKIKIKESKNALADGMMKYMCEYADMVGGKDMPVYMSENYIKIVPNPFEKYNSRSLSLDFVGKVAKDEIYLNSYQGYINPERLSAQKKGFYVIRDGQAK